MAGRDDAEFFLRAQQDRKLKSIRPARPAQGGFTNKEVNDYLQRNFGDPVPDQMAQSTDSAVIRQVQSRARTERTAREGILEALGHKEAKRPRRTSGVDQRYILSQVQKQAMARELERRDNKPSRPSSASAERRISEQRRVRALEQALDERDNRGVRPRAGRGADERYIVNESRRRAMREIRPAIEAKPRQNRGDVEAYLAEQARRQALEKALNDRANRPTQTRAGTGADEHFLLNQSLRRAMGEIRPSGVSPQGISRAEVARKYLPKNPRRSTQQAIETALDRRVGTRNPKHAIRREEA